MAYYLWTFGLPALWLNLYCELFSVLPHCYVFLHLLIIFLQCVPFLLPSWQCYYMKDIVCVVSFAKHSPTSPSLKSSHPGIFFTKLTRENLCPLRYQETKFQNDHVMFSKIALLSNSSQDAAICPIMFNKCKTCSTSQTVLALLVVPSLRQSMSQL